MNSATPLKWQKMFDPSQFLGCVLIGMVGGAAAGLAAGSVARVVMRVVAMLSGQPPAFSVEGTLFILGLGALLGMWVGLVFGFMLPFLPGTMAWKGIIFGLVPSIAFAMLFLSVEPAGELALAPRAITAVLLAIIPLIYGVVLGQIATRLAPRIEGFSVENRHIARTAGLLTGAVALAGAILEIGLAATHPAVLNLDFSTANSLNQIAGACFISMSFIGITGVLRSGAAGGGRLAKIGLGVALASISVLGLASVYVGSNSIQLHGLVRLVSGISASNDRLILLLGLLIGDLGLILAGIAALRNRHWDGWRAYSLLAVGLFPFVSILILHPSLLPAWINIPKSSQAELGFWLGGLFSLCWLAVGLALWVDNGRLALSGKQVLGSGMMQ